LEKGAHREAAPSQRIIEEGYVEEPSRLFFFRGRRLTGERAFDSSFNRAE